MARGRISLRLAAARNPLGLNINLARIAATLKAQDKLGFDPISMDGHQCFQRLPHQKRLGRRGRRRQQQPSSGDVSPPPKQKQTTVRTHPHPRRRQESGSGNAISVEERNEVGRFHWRSSAAEARGREGGVCYRFRKKGPEEPPGFETRIRINIR